MRPPIRSMLIAAGLLALGACEREPAQPQVLPAAAARPVSVADLRPHANGALAAYPEYPRQAAPVAGELGLAADADALPLAKALAEALARERPGLLTRPGGVAADRLAQAWPRREAPGVALLAAPPAPGQLAALERAWGYAPTRMPVAVNAIAVVVHPSNPIAARGLTLEELADVFAARPRGDTQVHFWADVGAAGDWTERRIARYGQHASAALQARFRERVLGGAELKRDVARLNGSAAVVQAVADDVNGIGYASLPHVDARVAVVPLILGPEHAPVPPGAQTIHEGRYPLHVPVEAYVNRRPGAPLQPQEAELLRFIYSRPGQETIGAAGFVPLPPHTVHALRARMPPAG